jgi:hypothetical protein
MTDSGNFVSYFNQRKFKKLRTDAGDVISIRSEGIDDVDRIQSEISAPDMEKDLRNVLEQSSEKSDSFVF